MVNNEYHIIDAWDSQARQIVKDGFGKYIFNYMYDFYWSGNILNGRPDGVWELHSINKPSAPPVMTEYFVGGKFDRGGNNILNYTDSSHIVFVSNKYLPLLNAETLTISPTDCNILNQQQHLVNARYKDGPKAMANEIRYVLDGVVGHMDMQRYYTINIYGEINENGRLDNLKEDKQPNTKITFALMNNFPVLEPAKINDKPVKQRIVIILKFGNGVCEYSYSLLPVQIK